MCFMHLQAYKRPKAVHIPFEDLKLSEDSDVISRNKYGLVLKGFYR